MASLQNSVPVQAMAPRQKVRTFDMKADLAKFARQFAGLAVGNVDEEQVLRDSGAQRSASEALGQFRGGFQLLAAHPAAQDRCTNVAQAGLALRMNAGVVAEDIVGNLLGPAGSSVKSSRDWSSARKLSAVQPSFRKRYFMRAWLRFSRRPC